MDWISFKKLYCDELIYSFSDRDDFAFQIFFLYSYFLIIRTVWMCHGCLALPAIFLFNLSMFRLFHCHWLQCVTIRTELCDLGILTVYYLIHSFWLPLMIFFIKPRRGIGFLRPVQSVPITNKVVSSSPVHGEVYSIQHYVIKFGSDLQGRWFLRFPPPIKLTTTI